MTDVCLLDKINEYRTHKNQNTKGKNEIEKFTNINTVKLKQFYLATCNSWLLLHKRVTIADESFEKIPAQEFS